MFPALAQQPHLLTFPGGAQLFPTSYTNTAHCLEGFLIITIYCSLFSSQHLQITRQGQQACDAFLPTPRCAMSPEITTLPWVRLGPSAVAQPQLRRTPLG